MVMDWMRATTIKSVAKLELLIAVYGYGLDEGSHNQVSCKARIKSVTELELLIAVHGYGLDEGNHNQVSCKARIKSVTKLESSQLQS
jgi:hypothetical protein